MNKKICLLISLLLLFSALFSSCNTILDDQYAEQQPSEPSYVELTLQNYQYYLTIKDECYDSKMIAGSMRFYHTYTVTGAIQGIYVDCVINFQDRDPLNLNAAGNGTVNYVRTSSWIKVTSVSGKIYI